MSNIKEVIQTKENKIIFLKAILLGIKYGKMENSSFYENNIKNELNKLKEHKNIMETNYIKNIDNYDNIVKMFSKKILDLENYRSNIIKNINNLSYNNYNSNYVKINLLRNNLKNINKELEINRNNILKFIEIKKARNNKKERANSFDKTKTILKERSKSIDKSSNTENNAENINNEKSNNNIKIENKGLNLEETINQLNNLMN